MHIENFTTKALPPEPVPPEPVTLEITGRLWQITVEEALAMRHLGDVYLGGIDFGDE